MRPCSVLAALAVLATGCAGTGLPDRPCIRVLNDRAVEYRGIPVALNFALVDGGLHPEDRRLLSAPDSLPEHRLIRILLDPGHGGQAVGAVGRTNREKDLNLAVAREIRSVLTDAGFTVFMTRDSDTDLPLIERAELTKSLNADLLLSIHHNARSGSRQERGVEVYTLTAPQALSTGGLGTEKRPAMPGNAFDLDSFRCAYFLQKELSSRTGLANRGVKHARFVVLAQADCPAVLLELGFVSTPDEETAMGTPERHRAVAEAVRNALQNINRRH